MRTRRVVGVLDAEIGVDDCPIGTDLGWAAVGDLAAMVEDGDASGEGGVRREAQHPGALW